MAGSILKPRATPHCARVFLLRVCDATDPTIKCASKLEASSARLLSESGGVPHQRRPRGEDDAGMFVRRSARELGDFAGRGALPSSHSLAIFYCTLKAFNSLYRGVICRLDRTVCVRDHRLRLPCFLQLSLTWRPRAWPTARRVEPEARGTPDGGFHVATLIEERVADSPASDGRGSCKRGLRDGVGGSSECAVAAKARTGLRSGAGIRWRAAGPRLRSDVGPAEEEELPS